jgi:hypothetical protein
MDSSGNVRISTNRRASECLACLTWTGPTTNARKLGTERAGQAVAAERIGSVPPSVVRAGANAESRYFLRGSRTFRQVGLHSLPGDAPAIADAK